MKDQKNLGARALRAIAELWRSDGPRSRWRDDGFDWWPGDFRVSVSALRRLDEFGPEMWQISVRTEFLKDAPINHPDFAKRVGLLSKLSPTYALVYPPPQLWEQYGSPETVPQLSFSNTIYVTSENIEWLPGFLGHMAIMQPINAQIRSEATVALFPGSSPAVSRPDALADAGLDGMLEFADQVYAPLGREPNRWVGTDEFASLAEGWNRSEFCHAVASEHGLSLETSFGNETALIELWTDQSSLQLGNGLLTTLQLPYVADSKAIAEECAGLNFVETLWTDIPQFGGWCPHTAGDGQERPSFAVFIPNALYGPGIASQAVYWMLQRARRLRQERWPDDVDIPVHKIFEARIARRMN